MFHVSLANFLLDHSSRILVLSKPRKFRVPETIAFGPFQEFNLRYEFGIDQIHFFIFSAVKASPHLAKLVFWGLLYLAMNVAASFFKP